MSPKISNEAIASLREYIDTSTTPSSTTSILPSALVYITDAYNTTLFAHASSSITPSTPPNAHSISVIQSLTKLVGAIAYLRLVERGLASLDDPALIAKHLPELAAKKVLTGFTTDENGTKHWTFEDRKGDITPRMLLNHTYGGGHTYFNTLLYTYFQDKVPWTETNEAADTYGTLLASPLLFQPGTKTNYGQGLDWLAVLIERITQQSLASHLAAQIFAPLHMNETGFEPGFGGDVLVRDGNAGKFWPRVLRSGDEFVALESNEPDIKTRDDAFPRGEYHTGCLGTGLVSSAADYTRLLAILLPQNGGVDPQTGYRVLRPESVAEITSAQLPAQIQHDSRNVPASGASPIILPGILQAPHVDPEGSFGLGCGVQGAERVLAAGSRGRGKGSVYWYGAANTEYWVDVEKGVVVYMNGNYYPWNEESWTKFVAGVEKIVYEGLKE
ncbi:beta-lactamase family protein [Paraphoma chrysanthemicola]|uniref:Beta-lactamase family protein n=1 Tax=Paraphoma chrysanthemicola TaxID=798071 RepID=A0A8K0R4V2_9PLEO|nr:beta-lactamase family protein [Paraphoma chrysanthemicola]